jgi:hypothetical protein
VGQKWAEKKLDRGKNLPEPSSSDRSRRRRSKQSRSCRPSLLGLLEDACGVARMQSVEYGSGYTCQFAYFRARWRESAFTRLGQNCSLPPAVSWTRGCLSATPNAFRSRFRVGRRSVGLGRWNRRRNPLRAGHLRTAARCRTTWALDQWVNPILRVRS